MAESAQPRRADRGSAVANLVRALLPRPRRPAALVPAGAGRMADLRGGPHARRLDRRKPAPAPRILPAALAGAAAAMDSRAGRRIGPRVDALDSRNAL